MTHSIMAFWMPNMVQGRAAGADINCCPATNEHAVHLCWRPLWRIDTMLHFSYSF